MLIVNMPVENLPFSNLDRLNRSGNKHFALGGVVDGVEAMLRPRNRLFPIPPPFFPSHQLIGMGKRLPIPFGKPHA